MKDKVCEFTGRTADVGFHHYYPRPYHKKHRKEGVYIYTPYHRYLHSAYENETLATELNDFNAIYGVLSEVFGL